MLFNISTGLRVKLKTVESQEPTTTGVIVVTLIGTTGGRCVVLGTALSASVFSTEHKTEQLSSA